MRKAGLREARQNLATLIEEVKRGREVLITDRGRVVARLVPATESPSGGLADLGALRSTHKRLTPSLSSTIASDRDDRF